MGLHLIFQLSDGIMITIIKVRNKYFVHVSFMGEYKPKFTAQQPNKRKTFSKCTFRSC